MQEYIDVIEAPEHLFKPDPRMRVPSDPPTYRTVVLPNVDALRSDPPSAGTMETLLGCYDQADADQQALWPGRSRFATAKLIATQGTERASAELVMLSLARLANRHGRVVDPLLKLPHQVTPFEAASDATLGPNAVVPPVVLVKNRLVIDSTTVPLIPPRVLDAALFQMALGLFVRATQRVEALSTPNMIIGGKPAARAVVLFSTLAQIQDMMAKLGVPQAFGTAYGYRYAFGDVPEVLHFAVDHDISADVTWDEPYPSAYSKVFDRVPDCGSNQPSQSNQPPTPSDSGGGGGGGGSGGQNQSSNTGQSNQHSDDTDNNQSSDDQSSNNQSQDNQSQDDQSSGGEDQPRPVAASVLDQATADKMFGKTPTPAGDITPSDAERAEIAQDMAQKFIGTEPAAALRMLAPPKVDREPTLGEVVREWAEATSARVLGDQLSPLRYSAAAWRRYGIWQPSQATPVLGDIAVVLDTSGSMGDRELAELSAAVQEICTVGQPTSLRVIACDTVAHNVALFAPDQIMQLSSEQTWLDLIGDRVRRIKGGGGTDMMAGITEALVPPSDLSDDTEFGAANAYDPQLVIVLTDGWSRWSDVPPPVRVVVATTDKPGPEWATTVKINVH